MSPFFFFFLQLVKGDLCHVHCPGMLFVVIYLVEKGETAFFSPERKEKKHQQKAKKKKKKIPQKRKD